MGMRIVRECACVCACVSECESVCKNVKETSLICLQAAFSCFDDGEKEKTLKERHSVTKICRLVNCCGTAVNYWGSGLIQGVRGLKCYILTPWLWVLFQTQTGFLSKVLLTYTATLED